MLDLTALQPLEDKVGVEPTCTPFVLLVPGCVRWESNPLLEGYEPSVIYMSVSLLRWLLVRKSNPLSVAYEATVIYNYPLSLPSMATDERIKLSIMSGQPIVLSLH